ncbi:MAG TPA: ATPase domain-containing protein [archaeon]|nr:ATPase domain-containing protein [archaeon]
MYQLQETILNSDRAKTGIPGLDNLINGGIPRGNLTVVSGTAGSGKTIFCWQFLHEGITKFNEPGIFISLEEPEYNIMRGANGFGWDLQKQVDNGKLAIISVELYDFEKLKNVIEDSVFKLNAKRVVIDPGAIFKMFFYDELESRKKIVSLGKMLKQLGCTTIITNETTSDGSGTLLGLTEYLADGVIVLHHSTQQKKFTRDIGIIKMRLTKIVEERKPIEITQRGLVVKDK